MRPDTGENDNIRFTTLEGIDGTNLNELSLALEVMGVDALIDSFANTLYLCNIWSNHTDGVICLGRREGKKERGDDGMNGCCLACIGIGTALTFTFSLSVRRNGYHDYYDYCHYDYSSLAFIISIHHHSS